MIDVYAFATPNSVKVPIALEEMGIPYTLHAVNVRKGEQKDPRFQPHLPYSKVPVLVDSDVNGESMTLTESAAILIYLAEKTGQLLPLDGVARARVFEQLFLHASGLGPALGNAGYFQRSAPESIPFAIERYKNEAARVMGILDNILSRTAYVAGDSFSIADIAHFGWLWRREFAGVDFSATPHLARWYDQLESRPAFQRGIARTNALVPA